MGERMTTPIVVDPRERAGDIASTTELPHQQPPQCALEFDNGSFVVVRGRGFIGRDPKTSGGQPVRLADDACLISRTHLEFWTQAGRLWMRDCNSRNGSEVEIHGRRTRMRPGLAVPVPPTSTILIGRQRIRVRAIDRRAVLGPVTLEWGAATRAGSHRGQNEDTFGARPPVFVVADGIGGHSAGELASREAVQALMAVAERSEVTDAMLEQALAVARAGIDRIPVRDAKRRPGTTVSAAIVTSCQGVPHWLVVNLGDSRTYRLDAGGLQQISVDHSVGQKLLEAGVTAQAAPALPIRNLLTRALVGGVVHKADVWRLPLRAGDRMLVCSDGLPSAIDDDRIHRVLQLQRDPQAAVDALFDAAIRAGGTDDMTAIVVDAVSVRPRHYSDTSTRAARRTAGSPQGTATSTRVRWRV